VALTTMPTIVTSAATSNAPTLLETQRPPIATTLVARIAHVHRDQACGRGRGLERND
jgi:hypothetical protein